jgi:molybdopterin-guanine dinucleotide biosynthesis protein A
VPLLDPILPVVLVGGQSRRFGRDKLQEPIARPGVPCQFLVDVPISALRAVFGPRVAICGNCAPQVQSRADTVIDDLHPGRGPVGGITSALSAARARQLSSVLVLAGDLPAVTSDAVSTVLDAAELHPSAAVIAARTDRIQPCIALYRLAALPVLEAGIGRAGGKALPLHTLIESLGPRLVTCGIDPRAAANINTREDLAGFAPRA